MTSLPPSPSPSFPRRHGAHSRRLTSSELLSHFWRRRQRSVARWSFPLFLQEKQWYPLFSHGSVLCRDKYPLLFEVRSYRLGFDIVTLFPANQGPFDLAPQPGTERGQTKSVVCTQGQCVAPVVDNFTVIKWRIRLEVWIPLRKPGLLILRYDLATNEFVCERLHDFDS